ncbi:hypothetical protein SAMN04490209_0975 [Pseudomonas rhodesiae]|uniref:Uncharacterized protein n=1 Tax=Pseudomonas rhodesiae TaxID=76760 RepID=A0AAE8H9K8_9PSED|nr:hypothetical protein SAMN04490209_0975 [Pseudomonas rhodesiae]
MPLSPSTTRSHNPPSYAEATNPRNPPPYEHPPSYAQATGTQPSASNSRAPSTPATNLTANRISQYHSISQANRGVNFMSDH